METLALLLIALAALTYGLVSRPLSRSILTGPMVFSAVGFLLHRAGLLQIDGVEEGVKLLAEATLVVVLFADAVRIDLRGLRRDHNLPFRMLVFGLPLGIIIGTVVAMVLWPGVSLWQAAVLSAILVPTDAALGQAVVTMKAVPVRLRQALNVESGLNDGIALPFVLVAASIASERATGSAEWIQFGLLQLSLGPLAGMAVGFFGGRLVDRAIGKKWCQEDFEGIVLLALPIIAYLLAVLVGGNGFLASFVAGMVFRGVARERCHPVVNFVENEGQLLILATFVLFGALMVPQLAFIADPRVWLYAVLSLTVIRMSAIGLSLIGSGLGRPSVLFLGWFGPRGLASILYVLLVLHEYDVSGAHLINQVVIATVLLSILAHGVTAVPAAKALGRAADRWRERQPDCHELMDVPEMPTR
jgi:NhaP-type Na+/H+ or K+/H+ antiporter